MSPVLAITTALTAGAVVMLVAFTVLDRHVRSDFAHILWLLTVWTTVAGIATLLAAVMFP